MSQTWARFPVMKLFNKETRATIIYKNNRFKKLKHLEYVLLYVVGSWWSNKCAWGTDIGYKFKITTDKGAAAMNPVSQL